MKRKALLLAGALAATAVAFAGDYYFRAITLAPLAGVSVIGITLATNLRVGLIAAATVGTAFSFVDAIESSGASLMRSPFR